LEALFRTLKYRPSFPDTPFASLDEAKGWVASFVAWYDGQLGLDHYEGRRFPGWHHHVSVALCCYAFIVAERVRHFPPLGQRGG
jgi:hypothetical protein